MQHSSYACFQVNRLCMKPAALGILTTQITDIIYKVARALAGYNLRDGSWAVLPW